VLNVLANPGTGFSAPLTAGGSLDFGFASYASLLWKYIGYN